MNTDTTNKIFELMFNENIKKLNDTINENLDNFKTSLEAKMDGIKTMAYADIKNLEAYITSEKPIIVNLGTIEAPKKQLVHKSFQTIIKILSSAKRKEKNIMLVGGAGGGKTHLVGSIAQALNLPFYPMSVGLQTTKSDLLGFINANGIYMPSPIRLAYENGGVLLLDEFDAAHAGVITILNSLLANGHCSFPDKIVEKHKDFVCLCACNTYGKGGTMDYVGRNRLDAAALDRFIIVDVDYDENLERVLTNHKKWTDIINKIRKTIDEYGIKMIVSPRASMDGADLLDAGFDIKEVLEMCVFKGCSDDIKEKINKNIDLKLDVQTKEVKTHYNLEIFVDFDKKTYQVKNDKCSFKCMDGDVVFRDVSTLRNYRIKIGNKDYYSPYLDEYALYLNVGSGKLTNSCDKNTKSQIEAFILDMKNSAKYDLTQDKICLSVINKKNKYTLDLNTGVCTEGRLK